MLTTKNEWIGIDGPSTQTLTYRTRLNDKNIGLGGYVYNDKTPNFSNIGAQLTFAYHIPMSDGGRYSRALLLDRQLSFGVSAKVIQTSYTSHNTGNDPADVSFNEIAPNANVGVYYVSYGFFAGLSVTNMVPFKMANYGTQEDPAPATGFLFVGNSFGLTANQKLEPSVNFNYDAQSHKQVELNLKYSQINPDDDFGFWAQISYRHNLDDGSGKPLSLIPMAGFRVGKIQLAYAYNQSLTKVAINKNYGTHEFMLAYTFCIPKEFCR